MEFIDNIKHITSEIERINSKVDAEDNEKVINLITKTKRIFIFGAGRSGLVGKAFAMRLVHLGKEVYFVGSATTPAIFQDDCLIVISGSGTTSSVARVAESAQKQGAVIVAITIHPNSLIGEMANFVIQIKAEREEDDISDYLSRQLTHKNLTPMGTLFELSALIYFDSIIPILMERLDVSEGYMKNRHANLE